MKTINKIIGIGIIALIAIVSVGAASAAEISTDLPTIGAWNYTPCPEPTIECDGIPNVCPSPIDVTGNFNVDDWNGYTAGIGDFDDCDCDSGCETHDDHSADHSDDHSNSESKNINTGLNRDRF